MCLRTGLTGRTEAGQVVDAEHASHVPVPAVRSVPTEAAVVPRTVLDLGFRVYVQERTLLVVTGVEPGVEVALRHLGHIVLVEELTLISLLAESSEPVLAHYSLVSTDVSEGTRGRLRAVGPHVEVADGGPRLVHPREWEGLRPQLVPKRCLDIEDDVFHGRHEQLHCVR